MNPGNSYPAVRQFGRARDTRSSCPEASSELPEDGTALALATAQPLNSQRRTENIGVKLDFD